MQAYVEKLKAEGYTQQVPGWDGVLVSPDGRTIVEVG
jgi:ribosomal protein S19E (S16A)